MTKPDEISSTEKLLDLIRSPGDKVEGPDVSTSLKEKQPSTGRSFLNLFKSTKKSVIGIDIGHTYIRMAKVIPGNNTPWRLTDYQIIELESEASFKDRKFLKKLQYALNDFCGSPGKSSLWATTSSSRVENRCIRIPKVPRKQIPNAVYWTFTKRINFDPNNDLLDYEILGEVAEDGVTKYEIMAFSVPKAQIREMADTFEKIGHPLTGISIVPFAIQNLFRRKVIETGNDDVCTLFIGRDWSRIAIYSKSNLVLSRGIKAGIRSMIDAIAQSVSAGESQAIDKLSLANEVDPEATRIFNHLIKGVDYETESDGNRLVPSRKDIFQMILPALERLVRQVERTIEHYCLNFRKDGISRLFISGTVSSSGMITNFLSSQLEVPITVMDPFPKSRSFVAESPPPPTTAEREGYVPAIGMALSDNRWTPNFLFTHEEKSRVESIRKVNMAILAGGIFFCMLLTGLYFSQNLFLVKYQDQLTTLNQKLLSYNPPADKNLILTLFSHSKRKRQIIKQISKRYYPLALIEEISRLTPEIIRLIRIDTVMEHNPHEKGIENASLVLEGLVLSGGRGYESTLSGYLLKLKNSPLLRNPVIQAKSTKMVMGKQVLQFRVRFELVKA